VNSPLAATTAVVAGTTFGINAALARQLPRADANDESRIEVGKSAFEWQRAERQNTRFCGGGRIAQKWPLLARPSG